MTREQLIDWRKSLRLTQAEMSVHLGYSVSGYRKLEALGGNPISPQLQRLIDVLMYLETFAPDIAEGLKPAPLTSPSE